MPGGGGGRGILRHPGIRKLGNQPTNGKSTGSSKQGTRLRVPRLGFKVWGIP